MDTLFLIKLLLITAIIIISVITDIRTKKIYNIVTFPAMLAGLMINVFIPLTAGFSLTGLFSGLSFGLSGLVLGITIFFFLYALGWFGGGDAKLMGAIGAFMGYQFIIWCILYTLIAGGVCSIFLIIDDLVKKRKRSQLVTFFMSLKDKCLYNAPVIFPDKKKSATFTYSIAIAAGFALTLLKFKLLLL